MARTTTIALDGSEKEQLNTARRGLFGTEEVPYGVVISTLVDDHPRVSEAENDHMQAVTGMKVKYMENDDNE